MHLLAIGALVLTLAAPSLSAAPGDGPAPGDLLPTVFAHAATDSRVPSGHRGLLLDAPRTPVTGSRTLVSDSRTEQPASTTPGARSWPARHPVLTGALIGLGAGAVVGAATCTFPSSEGPCSYYTYPAHARALGALTIGGIGMGAGAGIGLVVAAH